MVELMQGGNFSFAEPLPEIPEIATLSTLIAAFRII